MNINFEFLPYNNDFHKKLKDQARILVIANELFDVVPQAVTWNKGLNRFYLSDTEIVPIKKIDYWCKIYQNDDIFETAPEILTPKQQAAKEKQELKIKQIIENCLSIQKQLHEVDKQKDKLVRSLTKEVDRNSLLSDFFWYSYEEGFDEFISSSTPEKHFNFKLFAEWQANQKTEGCC